MRRKENEIQDPSRIQSLIDRARVLRLGLTGMEGPYIVPMNFAYEDGVFYLHSAPEGKKIDMLRADPRVCLEIDEPGVYEDADDPCEAGFSYASVIAFGKAELIVNWSEKSRALSLITRKYSGREHVFSETECRGVAVIKAECSEITGKESR